MKRILAVLVVAPLAWAQIFGFTGGGLPLPLGPGTPVNDMEANASLGTHTKLMLAQIVHLTKQVETLISQLDHMRHMALQAPLKDRFRVPAGAWSEISPLDTYGRTTSIRSAIRLGGDAGSAWSEASVPLTLHGIDGLPGADALKNAYSTIQLADGLASSAMATVGRIRAMASNTDAALSELERAALSPDDPYNTEIAALNEIGAAGVIHARAQSDTNRLLAALTQMEIGKIKGQRDAAADALNTAIEYRKTEQDILNAMDARTNEAIRNWRLP